MVGRCPGRFATGPGGVRRSTGRFARRPGIRDDSPRSGRSEFQPDRRLQAGFAVVAQALAEADLQAHPVRQGEGHRGNQPQKRFVAILQPALQLQQQLAVFIDGQAQRQVGSNFKPFVYLTALQQEMTPTDVYPAPAAIRLRRDALSRAGLARSFFVMEEMIAS